MSGDGQEPDALGAIYVHRLGWRIHRRSDAGRRRSWRAGRVVRIFRLQLLRRLPLIFTAILLFTIWPGVYFMDELIAQFLPGLWRPWVTYYWYLPLTVLPIPWMWRRTIARSTASAHEHARETIGTIARELGGSVE